MSTIERQHYKETKVLRTVSPVRNTHSSNQNLSEFDNNLGKQTDFSCLKLHFKHLLKTVPIKKALIVNFNNGDVS